MIVEPVIPGTAIEGLAAKAAEQHVSANPSVEGLIVIGVLPPVWRQVTGIEAILAGLAEIWSKPPLPKTTSLPLPA